MSYQIIYCPEKLRDQPRGRNAEIRIMMAAGMLVTLVGVVRFWPAGKEQLANWLTVPAWTSGERALRVMAERIATGKGWYHGLAAGCRTLLERFI